MRQRYVIFLFLLSLPITLVAQEKEEKITIQPDIHFRTFWMNTAYPGLDFKKDYALGVSLYTGANISYSDRWGVDLGYRTFANVASSEIWELDPISGQSNRYETGLFDLLDPKDRFFGRFETFSLSYSGEKFGAKIGRMGINSDWVNAQDGRLSPTAVEGIHLWVTPFSKWKFTVWGISRMNIRGSRDWLEVGETAGIYPQGRSIQGTPSDYFGNTQSDLIAIWEVDRRLGEDTKLHFSNTLAQNLFSTYWLTWEMNRKMDSKTLIFGLQAGVQDGLGNGGNENPTFRYKEPDDLNYAVSGRLGIKNKNWTAHLNYTHVGGKGRWLSPREWGKDAWYTFIPRERNEGFESVNALVGYGEYRFEKVSVQVYAHAGIHWLSDVQDAAANKYNFPSYRQVNLGLKYQPKAIKGLDIHLILVSKEPLKSDHFTPNQLYNKVEMLHFNGVVNWRWN